MYPFGNARSKAQLEQMKRDYLSNLDVEIENANVLETRKRKPDEAPPVPPKYKTEAELRADIQSIENELRQTIMSDFGYGYSSAGETISGLSADDKIQLLALFPQFKNDIAKDAKRFKLLKPSFVNLRIRQFLNKLKGVTGLETIVGEVSTIEDLEKILPTDEAILKLQKAISNPSVVRAINFTMPSRFNDIMRYLGMYQSAYPSLQQVFDMKKLNNTARTLLAKQLGSLITNYSLMTNDDIDVILEEIDDYLRGKDVGDLGDTIQGKISGSNTSMGKSLEQFATNWKTALVTAGGDRSLTTQEIALGVKELPKDFAPFTDEQIRREVKSLEKQVETGTMSKIGDVTYQNIKLDTETLNKIAKTRKKLLDLKTIADDERTTENVINLTQAIQENDNIALTISEVLDSNIRDAGINDVNQIMDKDDATTLVERVIDEVNQILEKTEGEDVDELVNMNYGDTLRTQEELADEDVDEVVNLTEDVLAGVTQIDEGIRRMRILVNGIFGEDIPSLLNRVNEVLLSLGIDTIPLSLKSNKTKFANALAERMRLLGDDYNPDDKRFSSNRAGKKGETLTGFGMKKQGRKSREDEKLAMEVKGLKNKVGSGMCGSGVKGRISVKKLIGKGIEVEQQPTYKQFGKYVMHYPHLMNNVLNVKYPSLGSIPAIKPKTISDDYKEFVMEVFDTGKVNPRLFSNLDDEEKQHFHKICKGAGLLETFKLKKGETDEEKDDLNRFNLLKGSYIAGNNGESVIRELRGLITKFIHEGRITKNEGLSMLMEII